MDYHKNAPWTAVSRERLARMVIDEGLTWKAAAARFSVSAKTAAKWVGRYRQLGAAGLADRSSRPHHSPRQTSFFLIRKGSCSSSGAHARLRDRAANWSESGFGQPHPAPRTAEPLARSESAAARAALRASPARRSAASGYQGHDALRRGLACAAMAGCAASRNIPASWLCMWPSTITRAWPSPRCCPIRRPKPPSAS